MRFLTFFGLVVGLSAAGCPQDSGSLPQANVTAHITALPTSGPAPLTVVVSAAQSSSTSGQIVSVRWDFAGRAQADTIDAAHTFTEPGRYTIRLTVIDAAEQKATSAADVRVQGGPASAVIQTDVDSGPAPLSVQFDGTASGAEDDSILDYFWDFGDGGTARNATPSHTFRFAGTYTVELRVVTFGGVEATTETTITVEPGASASASLQFSGTQFATLPVSVDAALSTFTFAALFKAEQDGGRLVSIGSPAMTLDILPGSNTVRLQQGSESAEAIATDLTTWRHIAVTYDSSNGAAVYLDGTELATATLTGNVAVTELILGLGFRGKVSGVSFWASALDADQVAANAGGSSGPASDLLGNWPLNDGSGQTLSNTVSSGTAGTLGATTAVETTDPAWSSDSP
jgi:PKD repeat protein